MSIKTKHPLRLSVIKTIEENGMLDNVKSVLIGFSGGMDSSVLFNVMLSLRGKYGFKLYAVHINHLLRGKESDADEDFVRLMCGINHIDLDVFRIDVPSLCRKSEKSVETAARDARYSAFEETVKKYNIDVIATAHNADDNTETVLYNLTRGAFVNGMCGIPYVRGNIIRPLRDCKRSLISDYASVFGITYVTDKTNFIADCTRNKIRLNILPLLREINPSLDDVVLAESKNFLSLKNYLSEETEKYDSEISLMPRPLLFNYILSMAGHNIQRDLQSKIADAVYSGSDSRFDIGDNKFLYTKNGKIFVKENYINESPSLNTLKLEKGINEIGNDIVIEVENSKNFNHINNYSTIITFQSANICNGLYIRKRLPGDKIRVRGMTRSVKKEFINKKIPSEIRDIIPVITDGKKIIAVPFIGCGDEFYDKAGDITVAIRFPFNTKSFK